MASIHLIDGEKGGVGKSWVARTMIQYLIDNKIPYTALETDRSNPTVKNIYPDVETGFFSDNLNSDDSLDLIFDYAIKYKTVVVNLPPQNHFALSNWIETKGLFELGKRHDISFVKWWVCDGEQDSIELFIKSLEYYQGEIPHILIMNEGRCQNWEYADSHKVLEKAIIEFGVKIVNFPKLNDRARITINANNLTFAAADNYYKDFGVVGRTEVGRYLRNAYSELISTGLLPLGVV